VNIAKNSVVSVHYTLKNDQDQILDSSSGKEPLVYLHGSGSMIPGFEESLEGKAAGDRFKVTVPAEKGYGPRDPRMVQSVPKGEFRADTDIQVGMQFQINTEEGPLVLTVLEVKDQEIVLDGNHPLAGVTLHFDVEVTDVRSATL